MANADRPQGFRPYGALQNSPIEMEAGSACYPGDFVSLASDGQVDPSAAGGDIFGLCLSYASAAGASVKVLPAGNGQLFIGQGDETQLDAQTDVGNLCDIVATAGNSTYKVSRQEVDTSTVGTGSGGQLVIMGLYKETGNAFGEFVDVIVKVNENQISGETDFAGI